MESSSQSIRASNLGSRKFHKRGEGPDDGFENLCQPNPSGQVLVGILKAIVIVKSS